MTEGFHNLYFDRQGRPISTEEVNRLLGDYDYKVLAKTTIGEADVSTVWLGINYQWMPDRPPLIFETMIFGGPLDQECWRYSTEEQALAGHEEIVRLAELEQQVDS
jgi:hypothetical protein